MVNYHTIKKQSKHNNKLIIYINGSELNCAIGINQQNQKYFINLLNILDQYCSYDFDMLIPDKINITQSQDHSYDSNVISHYTVNERVQSAVTVIDYFLENNNYQDVILLGASDGGMILPSIYNKVKNKEKVSKLIVMAGGGLSQYEEFKILRSNHSLPNGYKSELLRLDNMINEIKKDPDSLTQQYLGWPFKRWSSFMFYRPIDEYIKIDVPILVIHGEKDISTPVESSREIQHEFSKLGKSNLTYIEYKGWDHQLSTHMKVILKDISNWINER